MDSPFLGAVVAESHGLLRREIDHDEAIGTGFASILEHLLLSILEQRVVVTHKEHGSLQAPLPCISNHLQAVCGGDAIDQRLLFQECQIYKYPEWSPSSERGRVKTYGVCFLDGRAVSNWISEWHSELDEVCEAFESVQ